MRKKPKIKYTDMCIYIDEHIYEKDHDVEKIFEYLQMLFYALATKKRFFNKEKDYDEYSLYGATHIYLRLTNKNQFLSEDDPKWMPKVKSVLNYIKSTLYPLKVNFQQENYTLVLTDDVQGDGISNASEQYMQKSVTDTTAELLRVEVLDYLDSIPKMVKDFLKQTPYSNDKVIMHRLYLSCLITLLRAVTLSNYNHDRLANRLRNGPKNNAESLLQEMMYEESINSPLAWRLDAGMEDYVSVITNKIKKLIIKDIRFLIQSYQPSEEMMKDILMAPLSDLNEDNDD